MFPDDVGRRFYRPALCAIKRKTPSAGFLLSPLSSNLVLDADPLTPGQHLTDGRRGPVLRQKLVSRTVDRMKVHGMGGFWF